MSTVTIDADLEAEIHAVAAPDEDLNAFVAAAAKDAIQRRKRLAAGRAEMQAMLDGPRYTHADSMAEMRRKYNLPDLSPLSGEELEDYGDATLAALPPEQVAEARRLGLI